MRTFRCLLFIAVCGVSAAAAQESSREVRAVRLGEPLRIDGQLNEEAYATSPPASDFIQQLPREGVPATEPTLVWVFFDDDNIYIAARCIDSQPARLVANELRRDNRNVFSLNDNLTVVLDTFLDRRNGYFFQTNPLGAVRDQAIKDGGQNESWNTVWSVKSARTDTGYTVEMAIPFKSLRYRSAGLQRWGINFRRVVKWKNEVSNLTAVPASYSAAGITQMVTAATLVGLETPAQSLNLEVKPYGAASLTTDRAAARPFSNDVSRAAGLDAKYGLTRGLTADLTVNTDFAQVEEDQQQVNLTRFNLLFPEKRDFFLEGQGIFEFGGAGAQSNGNIPIMFFSRRIGLAGSQAVPVLAGGRVTGKAGAFDIGALTVRTDDKPAANAVATTFSAVRLKRDVLRRSSIGAIATGRWPAASLGDSSAVAGLDADLRFFSNIQAQMYWAKSASARRTGDDTSYRGRFAYGGDRYGFGVDHVNVGANFNPEVGFVRRSDAATTSASARFSPRLRRSRLIRRLSLESGLEYITNAAHRQLQDRGSSASFGIEFNSSDSVDVTVNRRHEVLPANFTIAPGVIVPRGDYDYGSIGVSYLLAQQRPVSGPFSVSRGTFYDGTRTAFSYSGRAGFSPHLAVEPTLTLNWISLPQGDFTARLLGARVVVAPTARLGFSSFLQFNAGARTLTASARMRWEYQPGSELFVVYSDGRNTAVAGIPRLVNRSFAVKATRLMRF